VDSFKGLPQNIEAEMSILSTILVNQDAAGDVIGYVSGDDFYDIRNRKIYEAMVRMYEEGINIDAVTVAQKVEADYKGGGRVMSYIAGLFKSFVPVSLKDYMDILKESSNKRKIIKLSYEMQKEAYGGEKSSEDIIFSSVENLYNLREGQSSDMVHAGEGAIKAIDVIEKNFKMGGDITGISTGFLDIDREINGLNRGDFIVLAARSSMGKTALALNIARKVSKDHTTAFFSLEMPVNQIIFRLFSMMTNIRVESIRKGKLNDEGFVQIMGAGQELYKGKLMIDDTCGITMAEIMAKCRKLKMKQGLDVVFVDYIGLVESSGRYENRQQEISKISRGLKNLAMELDVTVVALSQLNRAPEARSGNRPHLGDLRESGEFQTFVNLKL